MSPSSFHRHFHALTYSSPSQFSREYRRMFGTAPSETAAGALPAYP